MVAVPGHGLVHRLFDAQPGNGRAALSVALQSDQLDKGVEQGWLQYHVRQLVFDGQGQLAGVVIDAAVALHFALRQQDEPPIAETARVVPGRAVAVEQQTGAVAQIPIEVPFAIGQGAHGKPEVVHLLHHADDFGVKLAATVVFLGFVLDL